MSKIILAVLLIVAFFAGTVRGATDPITLSITLTNYNGPKIPTDFLGLSYEKSALLFPNVPYFAPTRSDILTSFENMGLRNLRIGGGTADGTNGAHPTDIEISNLFEFAQSSGVHVIYGLQLLSFDLNTNLMESGYVLTNTFTAPWLDYLAIGNEPFFYTNPTVWKPAIPGTPYDNRITNINSWIWCWESNANAIVTTYPGTVFAAPDENIWGTNFLYNVDHPSEIKLNTGHFYVFEGNHTTPDQHVADMLTNYWPFVLYPQQYTNYSLPWVKKGYPYRYTEMNDDPYVTNATDAFASALWALDAMSWWASNGCAGVNFHNNLGNPSDTIVPIDSGNTYIAPKGYAIKAFDLAGHGYSATNSASNPDPNLANVDCYAVVAGQDAYVTIVNKQYSGHGGKGGNTAAVTINVQGMSGGSVRSMKLTQTSADVEATNGVTLGGATLTNNMQWVGGWSDLYPLTNGTATVDVDIAEAAVVEIRAGSAYSSPIQINNNGTMEMFTVSNGVVYHIWQSTSHCLDNQGSSPANWVGNYTSLGMPASGVSALGSAVVARNQDGTFEVFVPGSDGNVYDNYQLKPSGSWSGWYSIGGPSVTNLQVNVNPDGSLNLFGIGNNGDIYNNSETAPHILGDNWVDTGKQLQPGFEVGQNLDGRLEIFGVDSSGTVWHRWQSGIGSTNWSQWNILDSSVSVNPRIQISRNLDGRQELFAVDASSGAIDYIAQTTAGQSWGSWNTISQTGLPNGATLESGFVVGQNANGRFEIFAVSSSNTDVWHNWITGSGTWNGWADLGGSNSDPQLVVANSEDGRLQIFTIGSNGDVWSKWQLSPSGSWGSWTDFGGNSQTFYTGQQ